MRTILTKGQGADPSCLTGRQRAVKMRKQRAATGGLPLQRGAECVAVEGGEKKISLTCKMTGSRFPNLRRRGKMDVPVCKVDRGSPENALALGGTPQRIWQDLED